MGVALAHSTSHNKGVRWQHARPADNKPNDSFTMVHNLILWTWVAHSAVGSDHTAVDIETGAVIGLTRVQHILAIWHHWPHYQYWWWGDTNIRFQGRAGAPAESSSCFHWLGNQNEELRRVLCHRSMTGQAGCLIPINTGWHFILALLSSNKTFSLFSRELLIILLLNFPFSSLWLKWTALGQPLVALHINPTNQA